MKNDNSTIVRFEPSPEVRAFIFQQIQDLEPMLENVGSLGVFIEKTEPTESTESSGEDKAETYSIRLVVAPGGTRIEATGESENIFEACIKAKGLMAERLSPFINATRQSAERDGLIHFYSVGGKVH